MNWTEGNLARHSRGRKLKEEFLRQREHFAKVRSGLLNPKVSISPPSISIFAQTPYSISRGSPHGPQTDSSNSSRKRLQEAAPSETTSQYFANVDVELPSPTIFQKEQAEDALRRKRQKLLKKSDWVGTDLQKPIQLEFSKPRTSLSNPWGSSRSSHHSSKKRFRHLLGLDGKNGQAVVAVDPGAQTPMAVSRGQLKVRVGNREKVLGGSSTASPRSRSYHDADASSNGDRKRRYQAQRQSGSREQHAKQSHNPGLGPNLQAHYPGDGSSDSQSPPTSPLLHHPIPCRSTMPQLLKAHSSESGDTASHVARVGVRQPEMPFSQRLENETWRAFVTRPRVSLSADDSLSQDESTSAPLLSPGVSQHEWPVPATNDEGRHGDSRSPCSVSLDDRNGTAESPLQDISYYATSGHPFTEPSGNTYQGNGSHVSSSAGIQTSIETLCEDSLQAPCIHDSATASALQDWSLEDVATSVSISDHSAMSTENPDYETMREAGQQIDDTSVIARPSSTDAFTEEILNWPCNHSSVREETASPEARCGKAQYDQQYQQGFSEIAKVTAPSSPSDESDLWRKFVFGESSDGFEKALEDARKQTARNLQPSTTPTSSSCGRTETKKSCSPEEESQTNDNISTISYEFHQADSQGTDEDHDNFSNSMTIAVPASHLATTGHSSLSPLREGFAQDSDTMARTDHATHGSPGSASTVPTDMVGDVPHPSKAWSIEKTPTSKSTHSRPTKGNHGADGHFKFAQPKPFLGKKTWHIDERQQISLSLPQVRGRNQTSRRPKRQKDGRTTIRRLPDFNDDPIEDFEDSPPREYQENFLFGSLEVEQDS